MHNSPYTPEFVDSQKARLETEKQELVARLSSIAKYDDAEGIWAVKGPDYDKGDSEDIVDDATEANEVVDNQAEIEELAAELDNVTAALEKIENGTYGWDEEASQYIPQERLEAYPAAIQVVEDAE